MRAAIVLLAGALAAGCAASGPVATPTPVRLRIAGSTSMAQTVQALAEAYQARFPHVLIDLSGGDSAAGLQALTNGQADLAAVSWQDSSAPSPRGMQAVPVTRDAIAIVVHPDNQLSELTLLQLKSIYQGEVLDWGIAGKPEMELLVISREEGSGTRAAFEAMVMGGERVTLGALVMPSSRAVVEYVARHPSAIGYVTAAETTADVQVVPVEGVLPSEASVRNGAYHLTRTLFFYFPSAVAPETKAFVEFASSPAGQSSLTNNRSAGRPPEP